MGNGHYVKHLGDARMLSVHKTANGKWTARVSGAGGKLHKVAGSFGSAEAAQAAAERDARTGVLLANDDQGVIDMAHVGFAKLEAQIARRGNVTDPGAVAAAIGRAKYGTKGMEKRARKGQLAKHAATLRAHAKRHRTIARQKLAAGDRAGARTSMQRARTIERLVGAAK